MVWPVRYLSVAGSVLDADVAPDTSTGFPTSAPLESNRLITIVKIGIPAATSKNRGRPPVPVNGWEKGSIGVGGAAPSDRAMLAPGASA